MQYVLLYQVLFYNYHTGQNWIRVMCAFLEYTILRSKKWSSWQSISYCTLVKSSQNDPSDKVLISHYTFGPIRWLGEEFPQITNYCAPAVYKLRVYIFFSPVRHPFINKRKTRTWFNQRHLLPSARTEACNRVSLSKGRQIRKSINSGTGQDRNVPISKYLAFWTVLM